MKIIVVGATGTIGKAVVEALSPHHTIVSVSHRAGLHKVDLANPGSIKEMYRAIGKVDAVISAAGDARFAPLAKLTDADFQLSLENKLMGQVNLVRFGVEFVNERGSFTLTSGVLSRSPMQGSAAISLVNAGLEGFARAAALELPHGIRINVVCPGWVTTTLKAFGMDESLGLPPEKVALAYVKSLEADFNGEVLEPMK
jgi:NAD(P)-dependent dehydrogenase (short-subunit alcohol dehydrogenase family)